MSAYPKLPVDSWVWGNERIVWGSDPLHQYTFKILEPKKGQAGCLSLQYHHEKSESWLVLRGQAWVLLISEGTVCTRIMQPGDIQNLPCGVVHRITALTDDAQIAEPSTPDRHAADKSVPKDVVRLHCYHGRAVTAPRNSQEAALVATAISYSDQAMEAIGRGERPKEHNTTFLSGRGAFQL